MIIGIPSLWAVEKIQWDSICALPRMEQMLTYLVNEYFLRTYFVLSIILGTGVMRKSERQGYSFPVWSNNDI